MRTFVVGLVALVVMVMAGVAVANYFGLIPNQSIDLISSSLSVPLPTTNASPVPFDESPIELAVEEVVTGLSVPWSIVFTSPDRMLVTERPGQVRIIEKEVLLPEPIAIFPEVYSQSEDGLMGMVLDPDYENTKYVYLSMTYRRGSREVAKVIRMTDQGDSFSDQHIIMDNIPAALNHSGNRLAFGPDSKLYITTGDATEKELAQDKNSLAGKILRLNSDGSIPADNPFPDSPVFSIGHRNPQGLDWHPVTDYLYATEHGPSGNDGPGGGDEINLIQAGQNYGWPLVSHDRNQTGLVTPLLTYTPAVAPASGIFYRSTALPQLTNSFLFGGLRGQGIYQVVISATNPSQVERHGKLAEVDVGRVRALTEGPDGFIYFSTSNQDGRGNPRPGDDKIYRLVPKATRF